ncbi:MAG: PH domain-containing protein [Streptosporangiales bacterium]|nr:PH domain-containing protein [Streptosporangiales bacterium]
MGLSEEHLTEDEEIVLHFHPHWTTLLKAIILLALTVLVAGGLLWVLPDGMQPYGTYVVIALALVAAFVWFLVPFLGWWTTSYVLTNRRFVLRKGIFNRTGRDVPLTRVNDISFSHNLIERMFGFGTLTVESAGERGQLVLKDIPKVEEVQSELYRLIEEEQERLSGDDDDDEPVRVEKAETADN